MLQLQRLDWATDLEVGFHLRKDTKLPPEGSAHQAEGGQGQGPRCLGAHFRPRPTDTSGHLLCRSRRSLSATSTLSSFKSWRNSLSKSMSMSSTWESE